MKSKQEEKKRPAHRPLKYGEETIIFKRRVPKSKKAIVEKLVDDYLKRFETHKRPDQHN